MHYSQRRFEISDSFTSSSVICEVVVESVEMVSECVVCRDSWITAKSN